MRQTLQRVIIYNEVISPSFAISRGVITLSFASRAINISAMRIVNREREGENQETFSAIYAADSAPNVTVQSPSVRIFFARAPKPRGDNSFVIYVIINRTVDSRCSADGRGPCELSTFRLDENFKRIRLHPRGERKGGRDTDGERERTGVGKEGRFGRRGSL